MQIWDQFLLTLEKELGKDTVARWVSPLSLIHFDAANIFLEAQDSFQIAWFEEHVRPFCKNLLNNNGRPIRVNLATPAPKNVPSKNLALPTLSIVPDSIDPEMTLDHFLNPRSANKIAYNLIAEAHLTPFNPVLLYGPSNSGKTHLLMAAASILKKKNLKVFFVRASTFTEHVVNAIRKGAMRPIREAYRSADALIVDDIHLFAKKTATQEEFFHTFNELHTRGCPIFLSSAHAPSKLTEIEPRLVSRFEWGISVGLEKEDWTKILEKKCQLWNLSLEPDALTFLVEKFPSSPLIALQAIAFRSQMGHKIGKPQAILLLKDLLAKELSHALTPEQIVKTLSAHFGITSTDILGKSQSREAALPRQLAMYVCRSKLRLPFQKIGEIFGRDHSTVMSSVRQIQEGVDAQKGEFLEALSLIERIP